MNTKRLLIQVIPAVGAIGLASCAPVRGGNSGGGGAGDGSSADELFGAWELRFSFTENGEGGDDYPLEMTYGTCVYTLRFFMEVAADLVGGFTVARDFEEGCSYSAPNVGLFPVVAEQIGADLIRLRSDMLNLDCPLIPAPGEMECTQFFDGADNDDLDSTVMRFERTSASNIPEPTETVGGGGEEPAADL